MPPKRKEPHAPMKKHGRNRPRIPHPIRLDMFANEHIPGYLAFRVGQYNQQLAFFNAAPMPNPNVNMQRYAENIRRRDQLHYTYRELLSELFHLNRKRIGPIIFDDLGTAPSGPPPPPPPPPSAGAGAAVYV